MPGFWDISEGLRCVQGGESHINKLRKPEMAKALSALAWFIRTLPDAQALLQEVRSLAGRITDGIDKPGTEEYVDHYRQALLAQSGLTPYSYTKSLMDLGVPCAGPPRPGHKAADSYVPGLARGSEALAATAEEEQDPGMRLFDEDLGGEDDDGVGDVTARQDKVSATAVNDDHVRVGDVDDPHLASHGSKDAGHVRAPAATDPLVVAAGVTVGRSADQSQDQARSQAPGTPAGTKKKLCKSVWRDDICRVKDCDRAHPPRCGDPRCFPSRRVDCQYWHRMGDPRQQQQRQQQLQQQGNGRSAGPGRAGLPQSQGQRRLQQGQQQQGQQRQQQQQHRRGVQQAMQQHRGRSQQQQQQPRQRRQQQQQQQPAQNGNRGASDLQLLDRVAAMERRMGQAGLVQQPPSYRDVVARGILNPGGSRSGSNGNNNNGGAPSAPARPDPAVLSTVVAAVMAVLSGQHF